MQENDETPKKIQVYGTTGTHHNKTGVDATIIIEMPTTNEISSDEIEETLRRYDLDTIGLSITENAPDIPIKGIIGRIGRIGRVFREQNQGITFARCEVTFLGDTRLDQRGLNSLAKHMENELNGRSDR